MPDCVECGSYTKFNNGLCYDCHDSHYHFNSIKGRIAETLIQELFLRLKYPVFRYGVENTLPGIVGLLKGIKTEAAKEIRSMPDFVIQNPRTNRVYFIEVKFRANETFTRSELIDDYPWENTYFIVVSKKHIKCITFPELQRGEAITPTSKNYLGNRKEFGLDRDVIVEFCDYALLFFQGV